VNGTSSGHRHGDGSPSVIRHAGPSNRHASQHYDPRNFSIGTAQPTLLGGLDYGQQIYAFDANTSVMDPRPSRATSSIDIAQWLPVQYEFQPPPSVQDSDMYTAPQTQSSGDSDHDMYSLLSSDTPASVEAYISYVFPPGHYVSHRSSGSRNNGLLGHSSNENTSTAKSDPSRAASSINMAEWSPIQYHGGSPQRSDDEDEWGAGRSM